MRKTMNALCLLLVFSLVLCLAACSGKEDSSGTYQLTGLKYADGTELTGDALKTEIEEGWAVALSDVYLTLNGDGTGILSVYGIEQEIGYKDGYFWYTDSLDIGLEIEEPLEFDEEGFPIENTEETEPTEPVIPEDIRLPLTISGKTVTLDPDGFGDMLTFTRK